MRFSSEASMKCGRNSTTEKSGLWPAWIEGGRQAPIGMRAPGRVGIGPPVGDTQEPWRRRHVLNLGPGRPWLHVGTFVLPDLHQDVLAFVLGLTGGMDLPDG